MSATEILETRSQERDVLLASIIDVLKTDLRVVGAWLGGSLGRGTADRLSDIDIYVVVSEQYARFVYSSTREFVARVPGLILTESAPRNAPPNGAYLLSLFHGDTGPHQVDWYWVTDRVGEIPHNTRVLFNSADIPVASKKSPKITDDSYDLENEIARFWALAAISAKKIARGHSWSAIAILGYMRAAVDQISWHLEVSGSSPGHPDTRSDRPPVDSQGQLAALEEFIGEVQALSPAIVAAGLPAPGSLAAEMAPLIDLARSVISEAS